MPFANVLLEQGGVKVSANQTNFDGEIVFTGLAPGKYDVKASYVSYQSQQTTGVLVSTDKVTYVKFDMEVVGKVTKEVVIKAYSVPLIDPAIVTSSTKTREELQNMVSRDVNTVTAQTAGTFSADVGAAVQVRGARAEGTAYYVDGVRVAPGSSYTSAELSVEQITTITGGIPAQYGDATGGVIAITTRGVQPAFFASLQGETSQYLDSYGKNYVGFSLGSPLFSKRDTAGHKKNIVGFIISGDFTHDMNPGPSLVGSYKVNDATLNYLEQNPLRLSNDGTTFLPNADFISSSNLQHINYMQNVAATGLNVNGKIQFKLADNTLLVVGGTYSYGNSNGFNQTLELFSPQHNLQTISNSSSFNARLTQRFNAKTASENDKTTALITNGVFTLQAEYSNNNSLSQDPIFKGNLFEYGYVGSFNIIQGKQNAWIDGPGNTGYYVSNYAFNNSKEAFVQQSLPGDSLVKFTPWSGNQYGANYTSDYYALRGSPVHNLSEIQSGLGLLNGYNPNLLYSLFAPTGTVSDYYGKSNINQFRVNANFTANIRKHNIQVGFEFQQQAQSFYGINPVELWTLMRSLEGNVLQQLDTTSAHAVVTKNGPYTYISYNPLYNPGEQSQFDKSLRQKLGLPVSSTTILNTDQYAPSFYSLSMFSPDDLLKTSTSVPSYNGYSYTGQKISGTPSFASYFTQQDANGNYTRNMGAYEPIYLAGYIQDQFDIDDLKIRAGLRIDEFNNNEYVLKDPYTLYTSKTAGEVTNLGPRPSSIPSNYIVYVDNATAPTEIVGYRSPTTNGNTYVNWYTPQGVLVNSPTVLANNAGISQVYPYLENPSAPKNTINPNAFTPYSPQINLMPRIAFSFPISDLASFVASYDITTQRPTYGTNIGLPVQYFNWTLNNPNPFLQNPALNPQQTTSYELGYSQYLNDRKSVSLKISAFYREMRGMIDMVGVYDAYPSTYTTYGNIDNGTVKGLSADFATRRFNNIQINANYTLQFASGTGSGPSDGVNLIAAGLPNLKALIPFSYDRRHTINMSVDYRYKEKADYNGPVWIRHKGTDKEKIIRLLENVGFNAFATAGSGTPYSRQANVTQGDGSSNGIPVAVGIQQRSTLLGTINGSNLPWTYRIDFKIDKTYRVTWRKAKEGKEAKIGSINAYIRSLNLLNTQNILAVYKYTGNPSDDGFLSSPTGQQYAAAQNNPSSFTTLYNIKVNQPYVYSTPRMIMIGFIMNL